MKKIRFIPILMISMVATSCGIVPLKEPTFSKYANKVEPSTFHSTINENFPSLRQRYSLSLENSKSSTYKHYEKIDASLRRGKKEIGSSNYVSKVTGVRKYDATNYLAEEITKYEATNKADYPSISTDLKSDSEINNFYQTSTINEEEKFITLNNESKTYFVIGTVQNESDSLRYISQNVHFIWEGEMITPFENEVANYADLGASKLYIDGEVFTIESNIKKDKVEVLNEYYSFSLQEKFKVQICCEEGEERLTLTRKKVEVYTFDKNTNIHPPYSNANITVLGEDKYTIETLEYTEILLQNDKVTLKAKDLSNYKSQ